MMNGDGGGGSHNDDDDDMMSLLAFTASNVAFQWLKFVFCVPEDTDSNLARKDPSKKVSPWFLNP
jgi:hypothetical protein